MALVDAVLWQTWSGQTPTAADGAALAMICREVDAAVKRVLSRTIEQAAFTHLILDSPKSEPQISLHRWAPITASSLQIWYNPRGWGVEANFDLTNDLLQPGVDYVLRTGPDSNAVSNSGLVYFVRDRMTGANLRYDRQNLAGRPVPGPGCLMLSMQGGYAPGAVPADITLACLLAVSKIRQMRLYGAQAASQSWNGASFSLPSAALAGVFADPEIADRLSRHVNRAALIG